MILLRTAALTRFAFAGQYNLRLAGRKETHTHKQAAVIPSEESLSSIAASTDGNEQRSPSIQLRDVHAISPCALRLVQHFVRFAYQRVKIFQAAALAARHSESR